MKQAIVIFCVLLVIAAIFVLGYQGLSHEEFQMAVVKRIRVNEINGKEYSFIQIIEDGRYPKGFTCEVFGYRGAVGDTIQIKVWGL
jgi:hypothetical protein